MSNIDLDNPPANYHFNFSLKKDETVAERNVRLIKDLGVFLLAAVFVAGIYWLAYNTVTSATASPEEKKWAMSVLSAGAAGLVGYLVKGNR